MDSRVQSSKLIARLVISFAATVLLPSVMQAATIFTSGSITGANEERTLLASEGERFELRVTFDPAVTDSFAEGYWGEFQDDSLSIHLHFPESGLTLLGSGGMITVVTANGPDGFVYPYAEVSIAAALDGIGGMLIYLQDDDSSQITTDALSGAFGGIDHYSLAGFAIVKLEATSGGISPNPPILSGQIEFLAIPEPTALSLLALASLALARRVRQSSIC